MSISGHRPELSKEELKKLRKGVRDLLKKLPAKKKKKRSKR